MRKLIDLTGQKFGRLSVIKHLGSTYCECKCECGNIVNVLTSNLKSGHTKSCGCLNKELSKQRHFKHGKTQSRLYHIYHSIKDRCYNKNYKRYNDYGGRGIAVCDEWQDDFQAFYDWSINNGYKDNLTIDRINNNGNYEPNNCRWVGMKQQQRNKRNNRNFTINGETRCLSEWCDILGLRYGTVLQRINVYNWSIEKALELEV